MLKISTGLDQFVLENGMTVLVKEDHASPVVTIVTYVKAGYFNEADDVVGISHLIEHMFFKGTPTRGVGEIARETKSLGGYLNASTIYDHTMYYTVLPAPSFEQGLEIQADALMNLTFDPDELKKETEVVIQEALRKLDTPSAVSREKLFELAFKKHRIRRWRIGTESGLRALTRDDFLNFHREYYRPENIVLAVVGDIDAGEARGAITKYYGDFDRGELGREMSPAEPAQTKFRFSRIHGDIKQAHFIFGFKTPHTFHEDTYALEILAVLLGQGRSSRLVQEVREKQHLVNSITAYNYTLQDIGILLIEGIAETDKIAVAQVAILQEIARFFKEPVTEAEMKKARNLLEAMYVGSMESVAGQARLLASYEAQGGYELLETYLQRLYDVTPKDILDVARKYFRMEKCSLLEYEPAEAGEPDSDVASAKQTTEVEARLRPYLSPESAAASFEVSSDQPGNPFSIQVRGDSSVSEMQKQKLENGCTLLVKHNPIIPTVSLGVFTPGGRNRETPEQAGLSELLSATGLKGTGTRSAKEIAQEVEELGASISFSSDPDYLSCAMKTLSRNFDASWNILCDLLTHPDFPEAEIAKEKKQTLARVQRLQDDMFRFPLQLFMSVLFKGHPYGNPPLGTPETLEMISRATLLDWHAQHFCPENLTIVAVGDIQMNRLADLVWAGFEKRSQQTRTAATFSQPENTFRQTESKSEERQKEQTALVVGFPGPGYLDEEYYALRVLQNILSGLGGRFFEELRGRKSLAYTVATYLVARQYGGAFLSYIATSPDKEAVAREGLLQEYRKLVDEPVSQAELEQAIRYSVGTHQIGLETNGAQMVQYAHCELMGKGFEEVAKLPEKLKQVTREEILVAARKYIDPGFYAEGVVRGKQAK